MILFVIMGITYTITTEDDMNRSVDAFIIACLSNRGYSKLLLEQLCITGLLWHSDEWYIYSYTTWFSMK